MRMLQPLGGVKVVITINRVLQPLWKIILSKWLSHEDYRPGGLGADNFNSQTSHKKELPAQVLEMQTFYMLP